MTTSLLQKVIASADAATGLVAAANGAVQKVAGDSLGRLWARVFGDTPHDSPDNSNPQANYPVKVGGRAAPSSAGFAAPVAVDDRTDAAFDTSGRLIVNVGAMPASGTPTEVVGNIANDAADSGNPVKVGGIAVSSNTSGQTPAVAAGDRVNQAMDLNGRALVVASGDVAQAGVDNGNPVKIGGRSNTTGSPGTTVTAGNRVNAAFTQQGMLHVTTTPNPLSDATTSVYAVSNPAAGDASGRRVIKASAGRLRRISAINNDTVERYFMIFNTNVVGSISTATLRWGGLPIPAGGYAEFDFSEADLPCTLGIAVALSTTQLTYTAVAVSGQYAAQYA